VIVLFGQMAWGGVPVVFDGGDPASVRASVAEMTGLPDDQLDAVPLDRLLVSPPQLLGDAVMRRCSGQPTTMAVVHADLQRAEAAWARRDAPNAIDQLDLAVAALGCLSEIVERPTAARIFLLRGELELESQNPDGARSELRTAIAFAPDASLPAGGADASMLLEEERAVEPSATVAIVPTGTGAGPWIDGRDPVGGTGEMLVAPGLHLAQHGTPQGVRSAWLLVGADSTLVVPGNFRRPVLDAILDPETRRPVERLVAAALPDFVAAYVSHEQGLWLVSLEDGVVSTTEIAAPPPPPPPPEDPKKGKNKNKKDKTR
jgi:hypothetical protein